MFINNKDFYPAPEHLIKKMLNGIKFDNISTILEPSAGTGNIIEEIKRETEYLTKYKQHSFDIDCIEIDPNLQYILRGKGFRVIHNDFLTYNTMKEYDLIIMNPPFGDGCKHLLKALEMQQRNGGQIVCLLNAETLKNPYSNERRNLLQRLDDYKADIEYISGAFSHAERQTDVETALINVQLPQAEKHSFIFDGLRKDKEREEVEAENSGYLAENDYFKAITDQYKMEVEAGIQLIKEYYAMKPFILSSFDKDSMTEEIIQKGDCILSLDLNCNKDKYCNKLSINAYIREVRGKYWTALFENPKFIGQLTNNLQRDFYNKIEELKDYDFSLYNIYQLKIDVQNKVVRGIEDTIVNLFDELGHKHSWYDETSKNIHYFNGWKTNKAWIINKKVIIPLSGYDKFWNEYRPTDYEVVQKLRDIEKCFHYLDGGLTEAIDLEDALKFAEEYGETKNIQLKYFTVTFYKKGTCHIVFNHDELLKKFNIFGSQHKGWLPPSYGKKTYQDMTPEEKSVIDEFEGENEYKKVMSNKRYYLFDGTDLNLLEEIKI